MAIARGFVTQPVEFNLPVLQIPFEAAYQQMAAMQQEKDTFDAISQRLPKYLQTDSEEAQLYRQFIDRATNEITDAFVEGNTSEAMRRLKDVQRQVVKQWQPGGLANSLEQRYQAYQTSLQEIKDHTKDFTQPGYQEFFQSQLQKQLEAGMNYDAERGTFNQITTPDLFGEVNLGEQVDDYLSGWKSDKGYGIEKSADGFWYYKGTTEQVTSEELTKALQGFYQRPDIQRAVGVQAWYQQQSIPKDMRPQVLQQYKEQVRGQLNKAITDQESVIKDLRKALTTGRNVTRLQETLNSMGYDLVEDGDLGPKTRAAAEGVIAAMEEDLTAARGRVDTMVENANLSQLFETQLQQSLTNAYVPKYAFTHRDVDMIANTPKIAMMKINAQRQMMDALTANFIRPEPTLIAPVTTQQSSIASIPRQYNEASKNYTELEQGVIGSLPTPFRKVLESGVQDYVPAPFTDRTSQPQGYRPGQFTPQNQQMRQRYVERSGQIANALSVATSGEQFNPVAYRQVLERQGVTLNEKEFQEHVELFRNRDNRMAVTEVYNQLAPAYKAVEVTADLNRTIQEIVANGDVDWSSVAVLANITSAPGSRNRSNQSSESLRGEDILSTTNLAGGTVAETSDAEKARELYLANDPKVLDAVSKWIYSNAPKIQGEIETLSTVDLISNPEFETYRKGLEEVITTNPAAVIDMTTMDKSVLEKLGFDKSGEQIDAEKILSVRFGRSNINGTSELVALVNVKDEPNPVPIPAQNLNRQYMNEFFRTGAAVTINPNDPSKIMDEGTMNMFSSMYYDNAEGTGNAYNAGRIYRMREQGQTGIVGMEIKHFPEGTANVYTVLMSDPQNTQQYLVTVTGNGDFAEQLGNIPLTTKIRDQLEQEGTGVHINMIPQGYQGIKTAVDESKATFGRSILEPEIRANPMQYRKTKNDITRFAPFIATQFND